MKKIILIVLLLWLLLICIAITGKAGSRKRVYQRFRFCMNNELRFKKEKLNYHRIG